MSHHMWCLCLEKATINVIIYSARDIMEMNSLILVNQTSVEWTADCVCTLRGERGNINIRSDQRSDSPVL